MGLGQFAIDIGMGLMSMANVPSDYKGDRQLDPEIWTECMTLIICRVMGEKELSGNPLSIS